MKRVTIIGCGVVGAAIAYELSLVEGLAVTVLDRQPPGRGATQAALGVLMGWISQKTTGRAWQLRQTSLARYDGLIPELEALTGLRIPYNRAGILKLCFEADAPRTWERLRAIRAEQGGALEWLSPEQVRSRYPQVQAPGLVGAVLSEGDRQVNPLLLTEALVAAARQNGVHFCLDAEVDGFLATLASSNWVSSNRANTERTSTAGTASDQPSPQTLTQVCWTDTALPTDAVVMTAGVGMQTLGDRLNANLQIQPVLGQALQVRLSQPLGPNLLQPVITGQPQPNLDIHIVPVLKPWADAAERYTLGDYWIGATVEYPEAKGCPSNASPERLDPERLERVWQSAIALCPDLARGEIVRTWSGLRPRPEGHSAPVLQPLSGYSNVWLATGHYRNGVLLAPATALWVRDQLMASFQV